MYVCICQYVCMVIYVQLYACIIVCNCACLEKVSSDSVLHKHGAIQIDKCNTITYGLS